MNEYNKIEFDSEMTNVPEFPSDFGPNPFIIDMQKAAGQNDNFRSSLWTGDHLQVTLMNIPVKGTVGLEVHSDLDQFLRVEEGLGLVQLGSSKLSMDSQYLVFDNYGIFVPAGIWHNIINIGNQPLKLTSVYAPPHYEWGTIHQTKAGSVSDNKS
nr:cupin domain-containing protein [uncultured Clostridium sp.]